MRESVTLNAKEQQRSETVGRWLAGILTAEEAALLLGCSDRTAWRLRAAMLRDGAAGLAHGNRGRASPRRLPDETADRIVGLATTGYRGLQRHPPRRGARRGGGHRHQPSRPAPAAALPGRRLPAQAAGRAVPEPTGADGPGGPHGPGRRQPARLARGPRALAHPGGRYRRRDGGDHGRRVPRGRGRGRVPARAAPDGPPVRPAGRDLPRRLGGVRPHPRQRGAARRGNPGRAGPGRARDHQHPGRVAPGQGPDRAGVGHLPGPAGVRAAPPGAAGIEEANEVLDAFVPRFNPRFAVPRRTRSRPGARCLPGWTSRGWACLPLAAGRRLGQLRPTRGDGAAAAARTGAAGPSPGAGWRSSCGSTAACSCSRRAASSRPSPRRPSRSGCARSRSSSLADRPPSHKPERGLSSRCGPPMEAPHPRPARAATDRITRAGDLTESLSVNT